MRNAAILTCRCGKRFKATMWFYKHGLKCKKMEEAVSLTEEKGQSTEVGATSEAYKPIPAIEEKMKKIVKAFPSQEVYDYPRAGEVRRMKISNEEIRVLFTTIQDALIEMHAELLNERQRIAIEVKALKHTLAREFKVAGSLSNMQHYGKVEMDNKIDNILAELKLDTESKFGSKSEKEGGE